MKLRYPAAALIGISFLSVLGWLWSLLVLFSLAVDVEAESLTENEWWWQCFNTVMGWTFVISLALLLGILIYRWFIRPSTNRD